MSSSEEHQSAESAHGRWFSTTHWSVVLAAGQADSPESADALERLCRTYWYPLYAYVRRQGYGPEDAQDLTQEFFARLLDKNYLGRADRQRGRFRSFLLTSLKNFLVHEWERARAEKRGGGRTFIPWDDVPETRYQLEAASDATPEKIFEQRWAFALFQQALGRLREELAGTGKGEQFEQLKGFLTSEPAEGAYAEVGARLGLKS